MEERKARQIDFILTHPTYDYSLWIFTNKNSLRRLCQAFVEPGNGDRIFGAKPRERLVLAFKVVIFAAVAASVAIAAVATPLYRQEYYKTMGDVRLSWFNLTEVSLGSVFILEFVVKIIADGFLLTPNAYLLSIWNGLDFFVLLTLIVNIVTALISGGDVSRYVFSALPLFLCSPLRSASQGHSRPFALFGSSIYPNECAKPFTMSSLSARPSSSMPLYLLYYTSYPTQSGDRTSSRRSCTFVTMRWSATKRNASANISRLRYNGNSWHREYGAIQTSTASTLSDPPS